MKDKYNMGLIIGSDYYKILAENLYDDGSDWIKFLKAYSSIEMMPEIFDIEEVINDLEKVKQLYEAKHHLNHAKGVERVIEEIIRKGDIDG